MAERNIQPQAPPPTVRLLLYERHAIFQWIARERRITHAQASRVFRQMLLTPSLTYQIKAER